MLGKGAELFRRTAAGAETLSLAPVADHSPLDGGARMTRVTLGKSRMRESCASGSVRARAEWLSYSTVTPSDRVNRARSIPVITLHASKNSNVYDDDLSPVSVIVIRTE
jgi:hypothetical protein